MSDDDIVAESLIQSIEKNPLFPALTAILMECQKTEPPTPLIPISIPSDPSTTLLTSEEFSKHTSCSYDEYVTSYHDIQQHQQHWCEQIKHLLTQRSSRIRQLDEHEMEYRCSLIISTCTSLKQELYAMYVPNASVNNDKKSRHQERDRTNENTSTSGKKARKKRGTLRKAAVDTLKQWLFNHFAHPYPTDDEKQQLSQATGLKVSQVNYWFINARVRIWRPMMSSMKQNTEDSAPTSSPPSAPIPTSSGMHAPLPLAHLIRARSTPTQMGTNNQLPNVQQGYGQIKREK